MPQMAVPGEMLSLNESNVRSRIHAPTGETITTLRIDCGNRSGWFNLYFVGNEFNYNSQAFVSCHEYRENNTAPPNTQIGDATFSTHNVLPYNGGLGVRFLIDWNGPLHLITDIMVINK